MEASALVARVDPDGVAFAFAHLPAPETERLDVFALRPPSP